MLHPFIGYISRAALGIGLALVFAAVGVVLARMGLLLFGFTSWAAWLSMLIGGAGCGAGIGSLLAWLWLKSTGSVFTALLALVAIGAGIAGGWFGYSYGAGVETECCASPDIGPIAYTVLGAVIGANLAAVPYSVIGQLVIRALRRPPRPVGAPQSHIN